MAEKIEIVRELPEKFGVQAAELLYEAFREKMRVVISDKAKALKIIRAAANYETGFYAIHGKRLAGIAGIQTKGNKYFNVKFADLLDEFCFFSALLKLIRFKLESLSILKNGEMEIVALSVKKEMRGKNIGTAIMNEIIWYAEQNGYRGLKLTVVDTNKGALRLYKRIGFRITRIVKYGFITRSAGFEAVIHMYRNLQLKEFNTGTGMNT
ncbi:MAG: GNAT family N-acetyltransferase [Candidatus Sabulitectum sp.]|nr:GNAT family N-acetyltransferase [Candidatus Sabulitectum sp.]